MSGSLPAGFALDPPPAPVVAPVPAPAPVLASPAVPGLPQGFTLDAPPASPAVLASPVSPAVPGLPQGFTLDAPPGAVAGVKPASPLAGQELTQTPVGLLERFTTNVRDASRNTTLGAGAEYLAGRLAPDTLPPGMSGPTPREQVRQADLEQQAQDANLPGWQEQPGIVSKALHGGAALAGQLVGGMASPEGVIAGPESYGAVRGGEAAVPAIAKAAGVQAAVQGTANAAAQGVNIAGGTQDEFSPAEAAQSAGLGAVIGAAHPVAAAVVNKVAGPKLIQIRGADGVVRTVQDPGESLLDREAGPRTDPWAGQAPPEGTPATPTPPEAQTPPTAPPVAPAPPPAEGGGSVPEPKPPAPPASDTAQISTATGRKLDVKYEVVPAADLVHATGDLQPRDRGDRAAYDLQIQQIAANLDPNRLMRAPEADRGAPIVGPDDVIESGNGRVQAINLAMQNHPEVYAKYVKALGDAGYDTKGVTNPVLVARRLTPMDDAERVRFTQEGSVSATAALSSSEQARVDGSKLTADVLAHYQPGQDPTSAANDGFVRAWIATVPDSERNKLWTAQDGLSADGLRRLNGAMLARAYGDNKGILARGLESTDDTTKNVSGALSDAAPAWAQLRAAIEGGQVPKEFDLSPQLTAAVDAVRQGRANKWSMNDVLTQQDAFNPLDETGKHFVRALYNVDGTRAAGRPAIADVLRRYATEASRSSTGGDLLGAGAKVSPRDALAAIMAHRDATLDDGPGTQSTMLGKGTKLEPPKVEPPAPSRAAAVLAELDARKAPDIEYKSGLSTFTKDPLKPGETWRDRLVKVVESQKAQDAEAGEPLADHAAPPAATGQGPTRPHPGGTRPGRDFNTETSPYRQVFRDAGHDPDEMVSRPIAEQVRVVADHVKNTFGFKDVTVDPKQNPKEIRDQLSNFYQNAREMANALGMPYSGIGLNGRLSFTTKPYRMPNQALGIYYPKHRTIEIPGRSNSFSHEWTHALDHYLAEALANNPRARRLLSDTKGMGDGMVAGKAVFPGSSAEAFVRVLRAIYGKDAATAAEALKLEFDLRAEKDQVKRIQIMQRQERINTEFAKNAKATPKPEYWASPVEMLARAHEAYTSEMMQRQGGDTRAVAKPFYDAQGPKDGFANLYPQQGERDAIFQRFTDLHDALRRESILDPAGTGTGARPNGLDIVDPHVWDRMADPKRDPGLWAALKRGVLGAKNRRETAWDRLGYNDRAADPGRLGAGTRAADMARGLTYSIRGIGDAITARQPPAARAAYQKIMDLVSPAEHVRSVKDTAGRHFAPVYEEAVRSASRRNINRMANLLDRHGLARMNDQQKMMLRHILTEGDAAYEEHGKLVPVPENVRKAAGGLRYLLDQEWERNQKAGLEVGYARSGFFPRMYDDHKIFGDQGGFERAAGELHQLMFEQEVGDDPKKLLAAHDRLPKDVRATMPQAVQDGIAALRKNIREQDKLQTRIDEGASEDPAADAARIAQLQDEARDLHDRWHDAVRDTVAKTAARDWFTRINNGDPTDFNTRGPNANYMQARKLPPEADEIMRDYMVNDPTVALPRYFQASARKVAFAERFGAAGEKLDRLIDAATEGGARGEDNRAMRHLVEAVTGRQRSGLYQPVERATNAIHALGSVALMPRAAWSSLGEPVAMLARTGNVKATIQALAHQIGDLRGTADSKTRAELANALGLTTSHIYDSVISDRTEGHYDDSPGIAKFMANYYRRTGLTQLTNSQRRSVMAAGHTALDAWSKDLLQGNARAARDAAAQFRDLGVPDAEHRDFAKWVTAHPGLPTLADLDTAGGRLWGHAVSRLTDKIIQDPMRVDKPLMSQNPIGRLAYGLMSFNYSFYHNIVEHALETESARVGEAYTDARGAGRNKALAVAATAPAVLRAGTHISAAAAGIFAASLASTTLREALFNGDTWQQHEDDGDLAGWLSDLAVQRTGVNGPLDPLIQAVTGLKYERDLSSLMSGAQVGYFLQAAGDMLKPLAGFGSPNTNTSQYNAIKGAWNMLGVPAAGVAMTALPGGPLVAGAAGGAMQYLTSRGTADKIATKLVGPKGTGPGGEEPPARQPKDPDAPAEGSGTGLLGGVPLGVADDFIAPGARVAMPLWDRIPGAGKVALGVGAAAAGASALAREFGRWKDQ